jgi:hypothetical protein
MLLFSIVGLVVSAGLEHAVVEKMLADNKAASGKKVILCFMGKTPLGGDFLKRATYPVFYMTCELMQGHS